jgi:hypothetical protein
MKSDVNIHRRVARSLIAITVVVSTWIGCAFTRAFVAMEALFAQRTPTNSIRSAALVSTAFIFAGAAVVFLIALLRSAKWRWAAAAAWACAGMLTAVQLFGPSLLSYPLSTVMNLTLTAIVGFGVCWWLLAFDPPVT